MKLIANKIYMHCLPTFILPWVTIRRTTNKAGKFLAKS